MEALSGHPQAGAERRYTGGSVRVHRHHTSYTLTRTALNQAGRPVDQTWQFVSLYDLFQFVRQARLAEVDLEATDWEAVAR